ncbi:MAG: PEP-CTERM sorting domain-containing protein, partial [Thiobacillaceae bacterium]
KKLLALAFASLAVHAHALTTGDIAFTAYNADEDGLAFVTFVDIAANTDVYFRDDEWNGTAFNTGESATLWNSGASVIPAGTVIRFAAYDTASRSASYGSLSAVISTNFGLSASNETVYAYLGGDVNTPTTFLAAIANAPFSASTGLITGTGLTTGTHTAVVLSTSADFGQYTGPRSGLASFDGYKPLVGNTANWWMDTVNGSYASVVPDTTAFTITAVPEPETYALMLAGLGLVGFMARRRRQD